MSDKSLTDHLARVGDTAGVYRCVECGRQLALGEFDWLVAGTYPSDVVD